MHQVIKTYDVRVTLSEIQYRHLQHRLQRLTNVFQFVLKEMKKRAQQIQQQRTYRSANEEERKVIFHRRYVYMAGITR